MLWIKSLLSFYGDLVRRIFYLPLYITPFAKTNLAETFQNYGAQAVLAS
jgi:hypothetical protein